MLTYFLNYKRYINYSKSKVKSVNSSLSINQIVRLSSKIFKMFRIKSCLVKSMTLKELLSNRGFNSSLIIGIKNDTGEFESHCWLEIQDNLFTHNKDISKFKVITKI